jgi:pyruvate,water dikinase
MIKPLVWSINIPVVNSSWKQLFMELTGPVAKSIQIDKLARSFYYRAYFNMSVVGDFFEILGISRDALEVISGISKPPKSKSIFRPSAKIIRYLPRMTWFGFNKYFYDKEIEKYLRQKTKQYKEINCINLAQHNFDNCFNIIDNLIKIHKNSSYVVIITQILNSIYNQALKTIIKAKDLDLNILSSENEFGCLYEIDPRCYISKLNSIYNNLPEDTKLTIKTADSNEILNNPKFGIFGEELNHFIRRFGHLNDNANDFSRPTWQENLNLTVRMILYHQPPKIDPSEDISQKSINRKINQSAFSKFLFKRAVQYQKYRLSVGFVYNFGFSLFRKLFLHIAKNFVNNDLIEFKEDIFYLTYSEIKDLASNESKKAKYLDLLEKRKNEMEEYKGLTLPETIFNDLPKSAIITDKIGNELIGVPTSRGKYTGIAKVVLSIQEFEKIKEGDVLVIPFSDSSWTPLFSKAKAVISQSGGILSHCSIIAREYGIPAVVSVKEALQIVDGTKVTVDGYTGKITLI